MPVNPTSLLDQFQSHPRLAALIQRAQSQVADAVPSKASPRIGLVYPCDALALEAAQAMLSLGLAQPVLIGPKALMGKAAIAAGIELGAFECLDTESDKPIESAKLAALLARQGSLQVLMKGSLHTDELMSAIVDKETGLRGARRISHAFVFDLPRYGKLLALADCVVNISPNLATKSDILRNAVDMLGKLGLQQIKVGIVAATESVNPAIPATLDAQALVAMHQKGEWPHCLVEGPFGFDNAFSSEAARTKGMNSLVAGDADLLLMPDLNAGNMLYKSFNYVGGGDCAGLVLGAKVPIVLTSRADSALARLASVALAILAV